MSLTEAGKTLYEGSKELLKKKAQIEKNMKDLKDYQETELTIGLSTSRGAVILPEILPEFHSKFPKMYMKKNCTRNVLYAVFQMRSFPATLTIKSHFSRQIPFRNFLLFRHVHLFACRPTPGWEEYSMNTADIFRCSRPWCWKQAA